MFRPYTNIIQLKVRFTIIYLRSVVDYRVLSSFLRTQNPRSFFLQHTNKMSTEIVGCCLQLFAELCIPILFAIMESVSQSCWAAIFFQGGRPENHVRIGVRARRRIPQAANDSPENDVPRFEEADLGAIPSQEDLVATPAWQLLLGLSVVGFPALCLPFVLGYYLAQWGSSDYAWSWLFAAIWCINAASLHHPTDTAFTLWARLPPLWRGQFSWSQLNSLLAPLMETALVTGATIGLPFAGFFALTDAAIASQLGSTALATRAAAATAVPQVYLTFMVLLLNSSSFGRRLGFPSALLWVTLCCLHAAVLLVLPSPVRELCALALDEHNNAMLGVVMLFLLEMLVVWCCLELLDYMHSRPALPPSCEVLGEALCLVDLRAWRTGLRRLRPGVAAAESAQEAAYYGARRWATWQLLLAGGAIVYHQVVIQAVSAAIDLALHPIGVALEFAASWTLVPLVAALQWAVDLALAPLLAVLSFAAEVALSPLITGLRWAAGLVFAARLFLLLAAIAAVFACNRFEGSRRLLAARRPGATDAFAAAAPAAQAVENERAAPATAQPVLHAHGNPQAHLQLPPPQRLALAAAALHGWAAAAVAAAPAEAQLQRAPLEPVPAVDLPLRRVELRSRLRARMRAGRRAVVLP